MRTGFICCLASLLCLLGCKPAHKTPVDWACKYYEEGNNAILD